MKRALPEMLNCLNTGEKPTGDSTEMTVLERMKWQQQDNYYGLPSQVDQFQEGNDSIFDQVVNRVLKADPEFQNAWLEYGNIPLPRTSANLSFESCGAQIMVNYGVPANTIAVAGGESIFPDKMTRQSSKKRKVVEEEEEEGDSKITDQTSSKKKNKNNNNRETSGHTSKVSEVQKPDYIHVRARRGQATDSHSLAERVRREKISERMKYLQDLVPGCNKITGKAGMLDEIINYVQSLQRQVEFLSMKLATVNPSFDLNMDNLFGKEVFPACTTANYQTTTTGVSTEMANSINMQFNQLQQLVSCCDMEMGMNTQDNMNSSCFPTFQPTNWEADLQSIYSLEYQQAAGRSSSFSSQPFTGSIEASNLKMEM